MDPADDGFEVIQVHEMHYDCELIDTTRCPGRHGSPR